MSAIQQVESWVKRNKRIVAAGGFAGAFLLLKKRGTSGGAAAIDGSQVAVLPVATSPNESLPTGDNGVGTITEPDFGENPPSETNDGGRDNEGELPRGNDSPNDTFDDKDPAQPEPAQPAEDSGPESDPTESQAPQTGNGGLTIADHFFEGATSRSQVGSGKNQFGSYTIWLITFPSKTERWWHYYKDEHNKGMNKWTGPHGGTGNSGGTPTASTPAPTPAIKKCEGTQYPFLQDEGERKGLCYKVVLHGDSKYRFYENGDKVFVPDDKPKTPDPAKPSPTAPAPAPAPAPTPVSSSPQPSGGSQAPDSSGKCPESHPQFNPQHGKAKPWGCYRVVIKGDVNREIWHYYYDGDKVKTGDKASQQQYAAAQPRPVASVPPPGMGAPAAAAPAPAPAPAPSAPTPAKCPDSHPFANNSYKAPPWGCYRVVLKGKERWHYYYDGRQVRVS